MKTTNFWEQELKENPHKVDIRPMYTHKQTEANILSLNPGERIKPHTTPVDAFFFVLEGSPTIHIGEEETTCSKYTLIESPANILHYIYNNSSELIRILIVKEPRPLCDID